MDRLLLPDEDIFVDEPVDQLHARRELTLKHTLSVVAPYLKQIVVRSGFLPLNESL
jgi:hypothetical protein